MPYSKGRDWHPGTLVAVDVDGTLINHKDEINTLLLEELKEMVHHGVELICWSSGGKQYAERILDKHNIKHLFLSIQDKPYMQIDDLEDPIPTLRARWK